MCSNSVHTYNLLIDILVSVNNIESSFYTSIGKYRLKTFNRSIFGCTSHNQHVELHIQMLRNKTTKLFGIKVFVGIMNVQNL